MVKLVQAAGIKQKVEELKILFDTESLNKLERLEFTFKPEIVEKSKTKKKNNKKKKEEIVVVVEENNMEKVNAIE